MLCLNSSTYLESHGYKLVRDNVKEYISRDYKFFYGRLWASAVLNATLHFQLPSSIFLIYIWEFN